MARLPDRRESDQHRPVRPLLRALREPAAARSWVYAVHPGGLPADVWHGLAAALPADVGLSVFDLQNVPEYFEAALRPGAPGITLPELAKRCREALAADLRGVPYAVVGWSFGGVVGFEMACGLGGVAGGPARPAGLPQQVVLLDSIAPTPDFKRDDDLLDPPLLIRWFAMYLAAKRGRPLAAEPNIPAPTTELGLAVLLAQARRSGVLPFDTSPPGLRKLYDSYVGGLLRNNALVLPYEPAPVRWPVTLVKATRSLLPEYGDLGWSQLAPVRLEHVPGDHYSILSDPSAWTAVADLVGTPPASVAA